MVVALDSSQPVFTLPPLDSIVDGDEDKPIPGRPLEEVGPLKLTSLVFGAAAWSHFYNDDAHLEGDIPLRTIRLALRYGIRTFDTSPYYGPSEIVLGTALKSLELEFPRNSYQLITKCGRYGAQAFDYSPQTIRRSIERSLSRMHTTFLDAVYLHDVEFVADNVMPQKEGTHASALGADAAAFGLQEGGEGKVWGAGDQKILDAVAELRKLQAEGLVKHIGICGFPLPTLLRLSLLVLHATGIPLELVQSYCHLTLQNATLLAYLPAFLHRARVLQVLTASPLSMGLLTPTPPGWHPAPEKVRAAAAVAVQRAESWEGGLPTLAIAWAAKRAEDGVDGTGEGVMPTVVGLSKLEEVHQAVKGWREVKDGVKAEEREACARGVIQAFEDAGLRDWSWSW
ncbi:Aldo/keto reductase [Dentipellis sp. KUC8613]|nr:Aldo/keto reductase [Dentipellis sp. KUC8613]